MSDEAAVQHRLTIACDAAADATGLPPATIRLVAAALGDATTDADGKPISAGAEEVLRALFERLDRDYHLSIERSLAAFRITSSDDVGRIVFALADQHLIAREPMDSQQDFAGVFDESNLQACLAAFQIERRRRGSPLHRVLSVASGTAGFGLALAVGQGALAASVWVPVATLAVLGGVVLWSYKA